MARPPGKTSGVDVTERKINCPHCHGELPVGLLWELFSWLCPHCGQEFLIVNDIALTKAEYDKRSSQKH